MFTLPPQIQNIANIASQVAPFFVIAACVITIGTFLEQRSTSKSLKSFLG